MLYVQYYFIMKMVTFEAGKKFISRKTFLKISTRIGV